MTTARAATLYGPKDLRLVDRPLADLNAAFERGLDRSQSVKVVLRA